LIEKLLIDASYLTSEILRSMKIYISVVYTMTHVACVVKTRRCAPWERR